MKKSIIFVIVTLVISWLLAGSAYGLGLRIENQLLFTVFAAFYMFIPAICAVIVQKYINKLPVIKPFKISFKFKSNSMIPAAFFHGTINAIASLPLLYLVGGNDLNKGLTGYVGFISIILISLLFYLYDRYVTKENIFIGNLTARSADGTFN